MTKDWIDYASQLTDPIEDKEYYDNDEPNDEYYGLGTYKDYCELWV